METTTSWAPLEAPYDGNDNGKLDARERRALPDSAFAYPHRRELPLVDAEHVRVAFAGLRRVPQVTADERAQAAANVRAAAAHFGVELAEDDDGRPRGRSARG